MRTDGFHQRRRAVGSTPSTAITEAAPRAVLASAGFASWSQFFGAARDADATAASLLADFAAAHTERRNLFVYNLLCVCSYLANACARARTTPRPSIMNELNRRVWMSGGEPGAGAAQSRLHFRASGDAASFIAGRPTTYHQAIGDNALLQLTAMLGQGAKALVQDASADGGEQAAHYLPGTLLLGGFPLWEYLADFPAAQAYVRELFECTHRLGAAFNRADTRLEQPHEGQLKVLLAECAQAVLTAPPTRRGVDRFAVASAMDTWYRGHARAFTLVRGKGGPDVRLVLDASESSATTPLLVAQMEAVAVEVTGTLHAVDPDRALPPTSRRS